MVFVNERHKGDFTELTIKSNKNNYALISSIYLISANKYLMRLSKKHIHRNRIDFESIVLKRTDEKTHILFLLAKELYFGTNQFALIDLCDRRLVSGKIFKLICNAMRLRRYGLSK